MRSDVSVPGDTLHCVYLSVNPSRAVRDDERAAQGINSAEFGDESPFDRQRVADVVTGAFRE